MSVDQSSMASNRGRRKRPSDDQLPRTKGLRTGGSTALDEFLQDRDDSGATSSHDGDDLQGNASTAVTASTNRSGVGGGRSNRPSGPGRAIIQDSSRRTSSALPDQQAQFHVCIDRDCKFTGPKVYFQGVVNQTVSKLCIACRALKYARGRYRRERGTNVDFHEGQLQLYMKARLQLWTNYHGRFGCNVLYDNALADLAKIRVSKLSLDTRGRRVRLEPGPHLHGPRRTSTRSYTQAVQELAVDAQVSDIAESTPPPAESDTHAACLPATVSLSRPQHDARPCPMPKSDVGLHIGDHRTTNAAREDTATSDPDSESGAIDRDIPLHAEHDDSSETASLSSYADIDDLEDFDADDTYAAALASSNANVPKTANHTIRTLREDSVPSQLPQQIDADVQEVPIPEHDISTVEAMDDADNNHLDDDTDYAQMCTDVSHFLRQIAEGFDRLTQQPVAQQRYFYNLMDLRNLS